MGPLKGVRFEDSLYVFILQHTRRWNTSTQLNEEIDSSEIR